MKLRYVHRVRNSFQVCTNLEQYLKVRDFPPKTDEFLKALHELKKITCEKKLKLSSILYISYTVCIHTYSLLGSEMSKATLTPSNMPNISPGQETNHDKQVCNVSSQFCNLKTTIIARLIDYYKMII